MPPFIVVVLLAFAAMRYFFPTSDTYPILSKIAWVSLFLLSLYRCILGRRPRKLQRIYSVDSPPRKRNPGVGPSSIFPLTRPLFYPLKPSGVIINPNTQTLRVTLTSHPLIHDFMVHTWFRNVFRYSPDIWSTIQHVRLGFVKEHDDERQAHAILQEILMLLYECDVKVTSLHIRVPQGTFFSEFKEMKLAFPGLKEIVWEGHPLDILAPLSCLDPEISLKGLTKLTIGYSLTSREVVDILKFCPDLERFELEVLLFELENAEDTNSTSTEIVHMDRLKKITLGCEGGHSLERLFRMLRVPLLKELRLELKSGAGSKSSSGIRIRGLGLPVGTMEEIVITTVDGKCDENDYYGLLEMNGVLRGKYGSRYF